MKLIEPMEPIVSNSIVVEEGWIHQAKWDGIRGLAYVDAGSVKLFTKRGLDRTEFYPELAPLPALLRKKRAVLDGELVILDNQGKPSFYLSLIRGRVRDAQKIGYYSKKYPVLYIVFDLPYLEGEPIAQYPLKKRQELLLDILKPSENITATDDFRDGRALFELMKEKGWEGIVSKRLESGYHPGKNHRDWFKTKLVKKMLTVVCGVNLKEGFPNSLVLGINRSESLEYVGRASLGLTQEHLKIIGENLGSLREEKNPFNMPVPDMKNILWIRPVLTCWVSFLEWTEDGSLRHPKIVSFSSSKPWEADGREHVE